MVYLLAPVKHTLVVKSCTWTSVASLRELLDIICHWVSTVPDRINYSVIYVSCATSTHHSRLQQPTGLKASARIGVFVVWNKHLQHHAYQSHRFCYPAFETETTLKFDIAMLNAACLLAFYGFLRCSEFTILSLQAYNQAHHLSLSDITVDSHDNSLIIAVHIKL